MAAIIAFFSWLLIDFASTHTLLIDMVYPYVTRMLQTTLAQWASSVTFCLWQLFAILLVLGISGEYIGRIYMCMNNAPQFVERKVVKKEKKNGEA